MDELGRSTEHSFLHATPTSKLFTHSLGPYSISVCLWIAAWCLQSFFSKLVTTPLGLDVFYFTLGARVFSILIFRFEGVIGLMIGSLMTNLFIGSAQYPDPLWFLFAYATTNTLVVYLIITIAERFAFDPIRLYGLSTSVILGIMTTSGLAVSAVHEIFFRFLKPMPVTYDFNVASMFIQTSSRIIGGMLFVFTLMLMLKLMLNRADDRNIKSLTGIDKK